MMNFTEGGKFIIHANNGFFLPMPYSSFIIHNSSFIKVFMKKIALITGAGSGIGKSVAIALYKEGYTLVLAGRRMEKLAETAKDMGRGRVKPLLIPTDVTDPASVSFLFSKIKDTYGRLDVLFNNAGLGLPAGLLEDITFEQWKNVIDTNITGVFLCTQEAFKLMKSQNPMGGRIINNGSVSAHVPRPNSAPYTASKHAVAGLTKSTSLDGRKYNIACGQIDIGNALTDMAVPMTQGVLQANGTKAIEATMPVEDAASAVVYMASLPLSSNVLFMTVMATTMPFVGRG
jgi:NAD(P)-dependent dehydrogenase (short-subunit alcohol dehydrogenase family)